MRHLKRRCPSPRGRYPSPPASASAAALRHTGLARLCSPAAGPCMAAPARGRSEGSTAPYLGAALGAGLEPKQLRLGSFFFSPHPPRQPDIYTEPWIPECQFYQRPPDRVLADTLYDIPQSRGLKHIVVRNWPPYFSRVTVRARLPSNLVFTGHTPIQEKRVRLRSPRQEGPLVLSIA